MRTADKKVAPMKKADKKKVAKKRVSPKKKLTIWMEARVGFEPLFP